MQVYTYSEARQKLASVVLIMLVGCATVPTMPEADARQRLADAGIELWPLVQCII